MARTLALVALGASLARRGPISVIALFVSGLLAVGIAAVGVTVARRGEHAPVEHLPMLAASAVAWTGALLHAVGASAGALRRDRAEGIRHLFVARTISLGSYVVARLGGLAFWLALAASGSAALTGVATMVAATTAHAVVTALEATVAAVVFGLLFAVAIVPLAFATLGKATFNALLLFVGILVVPEMLVTSLGTALSPEVAEVCALPSALGTLRDALEPGGLDLVRATRALVALAVFTGASLFFVRRRLVLLEHEAA